MSLELRKPVEVVTAEVYRFKFKGHFGWADFTIVESTGSFMIESDWGSYSYMWPTQGRAGGALLKSFLRTASAEYIVEKFSYNNKTDLGKEFDPQATFAALRTRIGELYKDGTIRKGDVKDLLADCASAIRVADVDEFVRDMNYDLAKLLGGEVWEFAVMMPKTRHTFLVNELLPFFQAYLATLEVPQVTSPVEPQPEVSP